MHSDLCWQKWQRVNGILWVPPDHQQLLALLIADPRMPDAEISARLGISAESIGPLRSRCLNKLRCDPAIAALIGAEAQA